MIPIKYHAPWHTLRHVCVGSTYAPDFYSPIKNSQIRDSLQQIARETEEDYLNLITTLESFDVAVSRPSIDNSLNICNFANADGKINFASAKSYTLIPRPPMQPRDSFLIVGDKVLPTNHEFGYFENFMLLDNTQLLQQPLAFKQHEFDAPLATVIGDTIILDCKDHTWLFEYFSKLFPDYNIKPVLIGGHNDAVYALVKPRVMISTYHYNHYSETFPNWTVKYIENQSWNAIPEWRKTKHNNIDRWWVPDSINNPQFLDFINTWLTDWVGYVQETVFDVNMLQIDQHTVLVNNYNKEMFKFLKQHKIEPIICSFRHRFFWDGGLHCITNDLYREGEKENYV